MRIAQFDTSTPRFAEQPLPCRLEQRGSALAPAAVLLLLLPLALLILTPFAMLLAQIAAEPNTRLAFADRPAAAVQIALGITLVSMLIAWPVRSLLDRLGRRRIVEIDADHLTVIDIGLLSSSQWTAPLSEYFGVAHNVRTTNAGPRHELILVHPERRAHVLLALSDRISEADVATAAARLDLPIVPAHLLYSFDFSGRRAAAVAARSLPTVLEPSGA